MNTQPLPGASNALTFGILSIVLTIFCCGPFGAIFSFIGLSSAKKAENIFNTDMNNSYSGYENAKTGRILSYIGLGLALIYLIFTIIYFGAIVALIMSSGEF
ncbi:CCC motif membrane protein [Maribacter sp. PR1]|uniref:CCC motif membrane protein n=1 Tax=Maribacter cobaltidurans TaxID=1178778 RepID=A0ABU7IWF1_9FLAO|nr:MULTISPECIES: CCC motif membrane protein [Maribacter]MDC6389892.1 CCC motif membrane protein [Maribacter sp. PR1]MEE1977282.1 CCC motif membrane protein [Maribacter cobaltidurans]